MRGKLVPYLKNYQVMKSSIIHSILFITLFCFVTSNMVYLGFLGDHTRNYNKDSFIQFFSAGVYQYRVLGKWLVLGMDKITDPTGKNIFLSIFYVNTLFLVLTGIVTVLLVNLEEVFSLTPSEKYLMMLLVPLLIDLTQYTVVAYDVSAYFFQLLITFIFLKFYETRYIFSMIAICLVLILSTLNRESSALSVAFMVAVLILRDGFQMRAFTSMCVFAWAFLGTYACLRLAIVNNPYNAISLLAGYLMKYVNVLGILFWLLMGAFVYSLSNTQQNKNLVILFHVLSLPYIITVFYSGILWEMRLYIPLFLGGLFLSRLDTSRFSIGIRYPLIGRLTR